MANTDALENEIALNASVDRLGPSKLYGAVGVAMFKADLGGLRIDQKINAVGNAAYEVLATPQTARKIACGLRQISETIAKSTLSNRRDVQEWQDRINGFAAELQAESE